MKISKEQLQKIIQEELNKSLEQGELQEIFDDPTSVGGRIKGKVQGAVSGAQGFMAGRKAAAAAKAGNVAKKKLEAILTQRIQPMLQSIQDIEEELQDEDQDYPQVTSQIEKIKSRINKFIQVGKTYGIEIEQDELQENVFLVNEQEEVDPQSAKTIAQYLQKLKLYTNQLNQYTNFFKTQLRQPLKVLKQFQGVKKQEPQADDQTSPAAAKPAAAPTPAAKPAAASTQSAETPPPAAGSTASTTPPVPTTTNSARAEEPSSATTSTTGDVAPVFTSNSDTASRDTTSPETRTSPPSEGDEYSPALERYKQETEKYEAELAKKQAAQKANLDFTQRSVGSIVGTREMDPEQLRADSERQARQAAANTEYIKNNPTQNLTAPAAPTSKKDKKGRIMPPAGSNIVGKGPGGSLSKRQRRSLGLEESIEPVSYNKLYENWKRFTKG